MARVDNYEQRFGGIGRLYTPEGFGAFASGSCVRHWYWRRRFVGSGSTWRGVASGQITMIDMDDICVTNINRQLPATARQYWQALKRK